MRRLKTVQLLNRSNHPRPLKWLFLPLAILLSGCNLHHPHPPHSQAKPLAPVVNTSVLAYHRAVARINRSIAATAPGHKQQPHDQNASFQKVVTRLQVLGYLPLTHAFIHGQDGARIRHDAFLWRVPRPLQRAVDAYAWNKHNPFIRGAVIQFERQNGILGPGGVSEGHLHKAVIRALFSKDAKKNAWDYEWVYVTKADGTPIPESLHVWERGVHFVPASWCDELKGFAVRNGWIWGTVVNTGVLGSTPNGTWPIYQRLPKTTMRGAFPVPISWAAYRALAGKQVPQWAGSSLMQSARGMVNGHPVRWQPYDDPGILWVNYFDAGRGIHYYPRASYGFPQSAGCVEQPYNSAPITYKILHYSVPVTISRQSFHLN